MRKWFVNLLCIFGAIIGLISFLLPWYSAWIVGGPEGVIPRIEGYLGTPIVFLFSGSVFVIGTLLSFVSPFGGLFQLLGVITMPLLVFYDPSFAVTQRHYVHFEEFEAGWWLALLSSIIVLISMAFPLGIGTSKRGTRAISSIFVIHPNNPYSSHIGILGVIGAFLCIIAATIPWYPSRLRVDYLGYNILSPILDSIDCWGSPFISEFNVQLGSIMFVLGTLTLFMTSIGIIPQILGFTLIILEIYEQGGRGELWPDYMLGMILAVLGMVITMVSIMLPVGLYGRPKPARMHHRLLMWGIGNADDTE